MKRQWLGPTAFSLVELFRAQLSHSLNRTWRSGIEPRSQWVFRLLTRWFPRKIPSYRNGKFLLSLDIYSYRLTVCSMKYVTGEFPFRRKFLTYSCYRQLL